MSQDFNQGAPRARLTGLLPAKVYLAEASEPDGTKKALIIVECHGELNILTQGADGARFVAPSADFKKQIVDRLKAETDLAKPVSVPEKDAVDVIQ